MTLHEPDSEEGVRDAMRAARAEGRRVRVVGGGTSRRPDDGRTTLSTRGLRGIVDLRPSDLVVTVLAGTPLDELDAALRAVGCELPLRPWGGRLGDDGRPAGTVGGAVASAADGLTARNGWRWRDIVLGARVVLPGGECVRVGSSVVKSVAGFDVPKALCGSHGEFGAITCLDVRIDVRTQMVIALAMDGVPGCSVAETVASIDALALPPRGCVVTADGPSDRYRIDAVFEGPEPAVLAASAALTPRGFARVDCGPDPARFAHWSDLVRRASAPPPSGLHRRVSWLRRAAPAARIGAQLSGDWVGDLLRGRATWLDLAPEPAPVAGAATAMLIDRVRRAFDPTDCLRREATP